ncbi:MAG: SDR family oxidoreductase [Flavobacteriaceae bacterium]|nr:SDR family oxidoreductase [Flavobacteriaceae bacterium]
MNFGLKGKNALVTASSQGLGKSVALELAKEGANLAICARNKQILETAKAQIYSVGAGDVFAIDCDLMIASDRDKMIKAVLQHYKNIDILVTNTGGPPTGKFEDLLQEDWDKAYDLLLGSVVSLIRGVLPGMKNNEWGRIITITSQAVKQPVENLILSNAVRASVVGLMKTLATELGPHNITVNNVMPGYTQTNRLKKLITANPTFNEAIKEIPLKRFGNPEEFAAAVAFLASDRASYITGVSLPVDGGWIKSV